MSFCSRVHRPKRFFNFLIEILQARQVYEDKEQQLKEKVTVQPPLASIRNPNLHQVRAARKRSEAVAAANVREERMKVLRNELRELGNMVGLE
jgi:hypothetical protein